MSENLDCQKLRKQFEELKVLGSEIETGLGMENFDVFELRKKQKDFLDLFKEIDDLMFEIKFPEVVQMTIEIWGKTKEKLVRELEEKGYKVSSHAKEMMNNEEFKPAKKPEKFDLVIVTAKDLGFPAGATRQQIYDKAKEMGLEIVPSEVGPQLRLQYENQPVKEWLLIGSNPLADSAGNLDIFRVDHNEFLFLDGSSGNFGEFWGENVLWVFRRRSSFKT